jgi:class 3 adenylate cyclase
VLVAGLGSYALRVIPTLLAGRADLPASLDRVLGNALQQFVGALVPARDEEGVLATVLFVDVVDSTTTARVLGDTAWVSLLDRFQTTATDLVASHRGVLVTTTGDGMMATFDGPGRAVRAAAALRDAVAPLGLQVRAGLHTAEIQRRGSDIAGIGGHVASRVAEAAGPGEVWVSRTVTDLVAGTGLTFAGRGVHDLKGFDRPVELFSALV